MRPAPFDYVCPTSPEDCVRALAEGGTALAGGQSLLPLLKLRTRRPEMLVDLNRVAELQGISRTDGELSIGAMTRHQHVVDNSLIRSVAPLLAEAARRTGDVQVRARGTVGGNVCFADPRANMSTALVALASSATVERTGGQRRVDVAELFSDTRVPNLQPGELLTRFHVPLDDGVSHGVYLEVAPQPNGVPIVNVAVVADGHSPRPRIAVGGLLRTTCRATAVEEAVAIGGPEPAVIARAVGELSAGGAAYADPRGDHSYRARIAAVLIVRALQQAGLARSTDPEVRG